MFSHAPILVVAADGAALEELRSRLGSVRSEGWLVPSDRLHGEPCSLVLLDLRTPGLDVASVCRTVARWPGGDLAGVLGVVHDASRSELEAWMDAGVWDFALASTPDTLLSARIECMRRHSRARRLLLPLSDGHLYDSLTQLPNRVALQASAEGCVARAQLDGQLSAILSIDLDGFKRVNDCFGQSAGDRVLQECARRFAACMRGTGEHANVLARASGDEFYVVAPHVGSLDEARAMAQRIVDVAAGPISLQGYEVVITASVGLAMVDASVSNAEEAFRHADSAMHLCKQRGKNSFRLYAPAMSTERRDRLQLEDDLRRAIERDELELHYQPKVNASTQSVIGCEALLRWKHPTAGYLPPLQFIPVAEESGLIIPLGEWVLRRAFRDGVVLQRELGRPLHVAVNVSSCQFKDPRFLGKVESSMAEAGIDPATVEIEITEGTLMEDALDAASILRSLQELGVEIALDDFGTGYSSLSYLRRFAIDVLKIDRAFVRDMLEDDAGAAIVEAILALAQRLSLRVVAEGVEDAAQLARLTQLGCDEIQGYYFSKPLPLREFVAWCGSRSGVRASIRPARSYIPRLAAGRA